MVITYKLLLFCLIISTFFVFFSSGLEVTDNEGWESSFENNATSLLALTRSEKKSYFFSFYFKATYFQAEQFCETLHMKLVTIENAQENNQLYKYVRDYNKGDFFWTSGSKFIDGTHWTWMTKAKLVNYTNWAAGNPDNLKEYCIALQHQKNVGLTWVDRDCLNQLDFICEREISSNVVAQENKDWQNVYDNSWSLKPNVPLLHFQDKSYYIGRHIVATYQEADQICKMMGMELVTITSEEQNDKLYRHIRDTIAGTYFWTSGSRIVNGITWIWMSTGNTIDYTNWFTGQPDSLTDLCLQLYFIKDKGLFWQDSNCMGRYPYICEKSRKQYNGLPDIDLRSSNGEFLQKGLSATNSIITMAHRRYLLESNAKVSQFEASQFCQNNGMQLLSIGSDIENEEVLQLFLHHYNPDASEECFWTSAKKSIKSEEWTWSDGTPLTHTNFKSNIVRDLTKKQHCVKIFRDGTWSEAECEEKCSFVCHDNVENSNSKVPSILNIYLNDSVASKKIRNVLPTVQQAKIYFPGGQQDNVNPV